MTRAGSKRDGIVGEAWLGSIGMSQRIPFFQSAEKPRMVRHAECQACGLEAHAGIKAAEALLPELTSSTCAKKGIYEIKEE